MIQPTVTHAESKQQSNKQNTSSQERQDSDKKNHDKQAETAAVDNTVKQPKDSNTTPANSQAVDDDKGKNVVDGAKVENVTNDDLPALDWSLSIYGTKTDISKNPTPDQN